MILHPLQQTLVDKPEDPITEYLATNDHQKTLRQREEERKRKRVIYNRWLERLKESFIHTWSDYNLHIHLKSVFAYHVRLSEYLKSSLNTNVDTPGTMSQSNAITEVFSMHQGPELGLQPLGALFIRKNGDSTAMNTPLLKELATQAQTDPNMSVIRYDLGETYDLGPQTQPFVQTVPNLITAVKSALYFREDADRLVEIKPAHGQTFDWIFENTESATEASFRQWLEKGNKCFWVNGKAGSGKSTLMKFIRSHYLLPHLLKIWAGKKQLVIVSYFFWYAGRVLQKSYEGVLRSLLHQILDARPELVTTIFPRLSRFILSRVGQTNTEELKIEVQELREAMCLLVEKMPKDLVLFWLVDGVDEFDGDHHDFSNFLIDLANTTSSLKILVSSRPISACSQIFSAFPALRLQDLTMNDMLTYINAQLLSNQLLLEMDVLQPGVLHEIETALIDKASGVFLWIVLVVKALLKGLGDYDDRATLMKTIDDLPSDLENLYDHMFRKMSEKHQQQGSLLLQLTVRARVAQKHPLTALQLYVANECNHLENDFTKILESDLDHNALRIKAIDGRLRSKCCGLVEVQYHNARGLLQEPRIDFLHRTVYDYLLNPSIWNKVTQVYDIALADIDLRLLVSVTHAVKMTKSSTLSSRDTQAKEILAACVKYSDTMSCVGDTRYVRLLRVADSKFLNASSLKDQAFTRECYHAAYLHCVSREVSSCLREAEIVANDEEANMPADFASVLVFMRLNFPDYFEVKLRKDVQDPASRSLLLKLVLALYLMNATNPVLAKVHSRNVHALLRCGTNPNLTPRIFSQGSRLSFLEILSCSKAGLDHNVIEVSDTDGDTATSSCLHIKQLPAPSEDSTPWEFWLFQDIKTVGHLHITICLLEADARVSLSHVSKSKDRKAEEKLERRLHARLEQYKVNGMWPQGAEYSGSQEPLPHHRFSSPRTDLTTKRLHPNTVFDIGKVKRSKASHSPSPVAQS